MENSMRYGQAWSTFIARTIKFEIDKTRNAEVNIYSQKTMFNSLPTCKRGYAS